MGFCTDDEYRLLGLIDYEDLTPEPVELPPRQVNEAYERPPIHSQAWVPTVYGENPLDRDRT